jgi:hypothetical protein
MGVMASMDTEPRRWNDDRLDEFAATLDRRFDDVDRRFDEVGGRFDRLEDRIDNGFERLNDRLDDTLRMLVGGAIGLVGVLLAGILTVVATQL